MKSCLIYLDKKAMQNSIDLLEVAHQLYANDPHEVVGIIFDQIDPATSSAFDRIIQVIHPDIKSYDQLAVSEVMAELHEQEKFDSIIFPASHFGRMLAPRLAMQLNTGLIADVTEIRRRENTLEIIRPAFSGRILAGITYTGNGPIMMSVRQGVFSFTGDRKKNTEFETYAPKSIKIGNIRCLSAKEKEQTYDIRESEVLISGGGGVIRSFNALEKLANKLNGQVAASRKIVDKGIASRNIQVGQSGKTVSPKLYIALGIHGAIQHVEGLKQIDHIISVNTNRDAPICSLSDIIVEGDAVTFIEKLVNKIDEAA